MKPIYLMGFMGCGKTTVGKILAKELGFTFVDLDEEIVLYTGINIPTIFKEKGEGGFRDIESIVLRNVSKDNTVISTGGGIITREENIDFMKQKGKSYYLNTKIEILYDRIHLDKNRPNAINRSFDELNELFISRKPKYEKAEFIIESTKKSPMEVAMEIIDCLNSVKGGDSRNK